MPLKEEEQPDVTATPNPQPRPVAEKGLPLSAPQVLHKAASHLLRYSMTGQVTPGPHPGSACRHLVPIAVHGQQAEQVEGMATLGEAAHSHWSNGHAVGHVTVPRRHGQFLHTDDAILEGDQTQGTFTKRDTAPRGETCRKRPSSADLPELQSKSIQQSFVPKAGNR